MTQQSILQSSLDTFLTEPYLDFVGTQQDIERAIKVGRICFNARREHYGNSMQPAFMPAVTFRATANGDIQAVAGQLGTSFAAMQLNGKARTMGQASISDRAARTLAQYIKSEVPDFRKLQLRVDPRTIPDEQVVESETAYADIYCPDPHHPERILIEAVEQGKYSPKPLQAPQLDETQVLASRLDFSPQLADAIGRVAAVVSDDVRTPIQFRGVHIGQGVVEATDGRRLYRSKVSTGIPGDIVLNTQGIDLLDTVRPELFLPAEAFLYDDGIERYFVVKDHGLLVGVHQQPILFPNLARQIPDEYLVIVRIWARELEMALENVRELASRTPGYRIDHRETHAVLTIHPEKLVVALRSKPDPVYDVPCDHLKGFGGPPFDVSVDVKLMLDTLTQIKEDTLVARFNSQTTSPLQLDDAATGFEAVIKTESSPATGTRSILD